MGQIAAGGNWKTCIRTERSRGSQIPVNASVNALQMVKVQIVLRRAAGGVLIDDLIVLYLSFVVQKNAIHVTTPINVLPRRPEVPLACA